jgi:hypothetical protein
MLSIRGDPRTSFSATAFNVHKRKNTSENRECAADYRNHPDDNFYCEIIAFRIARDVIGFIAASYVAIRRHTSKRNGVQHINNCAIHRGVIIAALRFKKGRGACFAAIRIVIHRQT